MGTFAKRFVDIVGAIAAIVLLSPLLVLIAVAIRLTMGSPVLFKQIRPGKEARPFTILKFRTMAEPADPPGGIRAEAERITRLGRVLRASSLDELPELWNVLRGDMSLVGPRPLLMEYLPLYTGQQARRHEIRPGITGWAQVNGRNSLSWEERFRLDVWYVDNQSFWLDLRIIALSVIRVIQASGINQSETMTMEPFKGREP